MWSQLLHAFRVYIYSGENNKRGRSNMKELFVTGANLTDAYHKALKELYYNADVTECPDYNQKQNAKRPARPR